MPRSPSSECVLEGARLVQASDAVSLSARVGHKRADSAA
jgi:hypothetical protein